MKRLIFTLAALAAAGCTYQQPAPRGPGAEADRTQASLDQLLAGRTARPAVDCINERDLGSSRGFGDTIVFEGPSRQLLYVTHPVNGCPELTPERAIRIKTPSTHFCRGDLVTVFDPVTRIPYGGCILGDFVPYAR